MFNKFALIASGLMLTISSVGCCCHGWGAGYGYRGCPPCAPCQSCPPAGGGYYQQPQMGAYYQGFDTTQTAYSTGMTQTAFVPSTSAALPTSTALAPVAGPPIYASAPANSLPTY